MKQNYPDDPFDLFSAEEKFNISPIPSKDDKNEKKNEGNNNEHYSKHYSKYYSKHYAEHEKNVADFCINTINGDETMKTTTDDLNFSFDLKMKTLPESLNSQSLNLCSNEDVLSLDTQAISGLEDSQYEIINSGDVENKPTHGSLNDKLMENSVKRTKTNLQHENTQFGFENAKCNDNNFEDKIMNILGLPPKVKENVAAKKSLICKSVSFLSKQKVLMKPVRYYKFPFSINFRLNSSFANDSKIDNSFVNGSYGNASKSDGSFGDERLYAEWQVSLRNVYKKYKETGDSFFILFKENILYFADKLLMSPGMSRFLDKFDIEYELMCLGRNNNSDAHISNKNEHGDLYKNNMMDFIPENRMFGFFDGGKVLVCRKIEIALVIDMLINYPLSSSFCLPFIISKHEFDNSIVYHAHLVEKGHARDHDGVYFRYDIVGPFLYLDFEDILGDCKVIGDE